MTKAIHLAGGGEICHSLEELIPRHCQQPVELTLELQVTEVRPDGFGLPSFP